MKKRWTALLLALVLALVPALALAQEDPTVVQVGTVSYPLSLVSFSLQSAIDLAQYLGEVTEEDLQAAKEETIERFIGMGIIENKLMRAGRNEFSDSEKELLMAQARNQYEQIWQEFLRQLQQAGEDVTEEEVTSWLEAQGYTQEAIYRELLVSERQYRMFELFCRDVTVTPQEIADYYLSQYVEPDKARYADNIPLYEDEILMTGSEAFYTPEGYRGVKQILLAFPEALTAQLKVMARGPLQKAQNAYNAAYDALAQAAARGDDTAPFKAAYDAAKDVLEQQQKTYADKQAEALDLLRGTTDEIARRYAAGESFEALMKEFSTDQNHVDTQDSGYLLHPLSEYWATAFKHAACALSKPGDISQPVVTDAGVHIILYACDIPSGMHRLTQEEGDVLAQSALYAAKVARLSELIEGWKKDYTIRVDASMLDAVMY
ncbi:MAG: peptidylprolyl isomerase [Aristaeellaceae bacterium]